MSIRKICISAALLLFCLGVAHGSGRALAEAPAPAHFNFSNTSAKCTPGNTIGGSLGGFDGHGWHQSIGCAPGEIVTSITLGTTAWEPYTPCSIAIQCTPSAFGTAGFPTTKNFTLPSARSTTTNFTTLASDDGFNSASVFTSNGTVNSSIMNLHMKFNPIVEMSFGTPDSRSISAGTPGATISGDSTDQAVFNLPSNARITALGIFYQQYINSVSISAICPDLAGTDSVSPPANAVQG